MRLVPTLRLESRVSVRGWDVDMLAIVGEDAWLVVGAVGSNDHYTAGGPTGPRPWWLRPLRRCPLMIAAAGSHLAWLAIANIVVAV